LPNVKMGKTEKQGGGGHWNREIKI
jgi:hypothetical protein